MSIGIKGSSEQILETHLKLDKLVETLEEISSYWNGEDESYIGPDGEVYNEEDANIALEAIEQIKKLKELLSEIGITY